MRERFLATTPSLDSELDQLVAWLHERSMAPWTIGALQSALIERLDAIGFAIDRMHIGLPMLHPLYTIGTYYWTRDAGSSTGTFDRGTSEDDAWLKSPLRFVFDAGANEQRFELNESNAKRFPMLTAMREGGATEAYSRHRTRLRLR